MNKLLLLLLSVTLAFTSCGSDDDGGSQPSFPDDPILGEWTTSSITEDGEAVDLGCGQNSLLNFSANGTYTFIASIEDSEDEDLQVDETDETVEDELDMDVNDADEVDDTNDIDDTDEVDADDTDMLNCIFDQEVNVRQWIPNNNGTYTFIINELERVDDAQVEFTDNEFTSTYMDANGVVVVERYVRN